MFQNIKLPKELVSVVGSENQDFAVKSDHVHKH